MKRFRCRRTCSVSGHDSGTELAAAPCRGLLIGSQGLWLLSLCRYTNTYPLCLSLLEQGAINCEPLITHRYGFSADEVAKGFDTAMNAKVTKSIKVMFHL